MAQKIEPEAPSSLRHAGKFSRNLLKLLPGILRDASSYWISDNVPRLGAAVAFYALLSLAPIIVMAVAVAALLYGEQAAQGQLALQIEGIAGTEAARTIQGIIQGAYQPRTGAIATLLGLATLVFAASSLFLELRDAMNTIWGLPLPVDHNHMATVVRLIRDRFYSFAMVAGIGFLLLMALVVSAAIVAMRIKAPPAVASIILYLLVVVLFAALYRILPDVSLTWSDVAFGAMLASLMFVFGKQLMALYFAYTDFGSIYGAAGSAIVVLLWVYYSAQLFFWGAEFSKVYTKTLGSHAVRQC